MRSTTVYRTLFAAVLGMSVWTAAAAPYNDLQAFGYVAEADAAAMVVSGNARFSVLTPSVIRIEYDQLSQFEDRPTIAIVNRKLTVPIFTTNMSDGLLTITTPQVTLRYVTGTPFTSMTLTAVSADGTEWHYGDVDNANLLGTVRSLDMLCTISLNCTDNSDVSVHNESLHCAWGVVSRGGWTTIDDTGNYILGSRPGEWFSNSLRNRDDVDLYFFGHASNYRAALQDFVAIAGKIPMLPRPMLGSWFTRWYDFDNGDIERLVDIYESSSLPLTTFIFDMNWHTKNDWTGYSWDTQLYPFPQDTLNWLRSKGLIFAANLHDADGVGVWETSYAQMCDAIGQDANALQPIAFQPLNGTYMHALDDIALKAAGLDFYWIDWQQGGWAGGCSGGRLNPTIITDHVRSTDNLRTGVDKRGAVLARFGGLGNHRYPVGFSGDVLDLSWECMAFQPYFSITGANVGYGYISNDLVGPPHDHELHVRWMQFGAYSGVMRIHDRGMSAGGCWKDGTCAIVNIWRLPFRYFAAIRDAMLARVALLPYLYTESFNTFQTGVSVAYPMYYDWPHHGNAYNMGPDGAHAQYMFGPNLLVAPICAAADTSTNLVSKVVWLPPGLWYDDIFGIVHSVQSADGMQLTQQYALEDVPLFVRGGAIVPRLPNPEQIGVGTQPNTALDIYIYPGNESSMYELYEDDGMSYGYLTGAYSWILIQYTRTNSTLTISVSAANTSLPWIPAQRHWRFFLVSTVPLMSATVNGSPLPYQRFGGASSWTFDGKTATTVLDLGLMSSATALSISVESIAENDGGLLHRAKGYASRLRLAKRLLDDVRETPYSEQTGPGVFKTAAAHAVKLSYLAGFNSTEFLNDVGDAYETLVMNALTEIGGTPNPVPQHVALTQLWDSDRHDMLLCGSQECLDVNYFYTVMWTEGYQPLSGEAGSVTLYDYYSSQYTDNYATTSVTTPNGYSPAIFSNGFVYDASATDRACLSVYFSPATNDHLTTATQAGINFAQNNGYVRSHNCVAYVRTSANEVHYNGTITAGELSKRMTAKKQLNAAAAGYFAQAQALVASALP